MGRMYVYVGAQLLLSFVFVYVAATYRSSGCWPPPQMAPSEMFISGQ